MSLLLEVPHCGVADAQVVLVHLPPRAAPVLVQPAHAPAHCSMLTNICGCLGGCGRGRGAATCLEGRGADHLDTDTQANYTYSARAPAAVLTCRSGVWQSSRCKAGGAIAAPNSSNTGSAHGSAACGGRLCGLHAQLLLAVELAQPAWVMARECRMSCRAAGSRPAATWSGAA